VVQTTATFTQGKLSEQIIKMALTNLVGLSVFFIADLIDLYFISLLNQPYLVTAIAYAAAILLFTMSITIALSIANSAVTGKLIGQNKKQQAKQASMTCYLLTLLTSVTVSMIVYCYAKPLLQFIGANDKTLHAATEYLNITLISFPMIALGMQIMTTLRLLGKAKLSMHCTLMAGLINVLLDPILIFYFKLEIQGAAFATLIARMAMLLLASYYLFKTGYFVTYLSWTDIKTQSKRILNVAIPASLTQLATPISHCYITYEMAKFGANYVAGWAIINRLIPVVFMMLFAMPGAIGPIISQNAGAHQFNRIKTTLNESLNFIIKYVFVLSLSLSLLQEYIVSFFNAQLETAFLIRFFCQYISLTFIFVAMNLVALSFLNNMGYPKTASTLNLAKMTLGTVPFVSVGAYYYGPQGILIGQALGSITFAIVAIIICYRIFRKIAYNPLSFE
jgi:putative MATE family efflux protein